MFDEVRKRKADAKWIIGIITCCSLIYLGIRYFSDIADGVIRVAEMAMPLWLGIVLALIFNVPMTFIENHLLRKYSLKRGKRAIAIALSLVLVIGLFVGVAFIVIPKLVEAVALLIEIAAKGLDQMAAIEENSQLMESTLGEWFVELDIDWIGLKVKMENWVASQSGVLVDQIVNITRDIAAKIVMLFIGMVFAVYVLANKETLKRQVCRLIRVWLPKPIGEPMIHVADISSQIFKRFVAGQALEAIILGTLCMTGMRILRMPYAPMIGALVGVMALIPIVGAFVGTIVGAVMILTVSPFKAVVFVIFLQILQQVEGNLIYPKVVGAKIKLSAIWVLAAVTIGGNVAGPLGMFLGVPAASAVYALLRKATDEREASKKENLHNM